MDAAVDTSADATLADVLASSSKSLSPSTLQDPQAKEYLTHLTRLPLTELREEPSTLNTQAHHLSSSLSSLTYTSYPTFIALHGATSSLNDSLLSLGSSLEELLKTSLPALDASATEFQKRTAPILHARAQARSVLDQHDKLRDLLDAPLLIDSCVRNGYFSEALSLAAHVAKTAATTDEPVLNAVRREVDQSIRAMLGMLLSTLRESGRKLPALWKAASFVRRMEVLDEEELALAFLSGRGDCLQTTLESLGRDMYVEEADENSDRAREDATRYLRKYIDTWREGVHDIITQFSVIFLEDRIGPQPSASSTTPSSPFKLSFVTSKTPEPPDPHQLRSLLAAYFSHALQTFLLPTLKTYLPRVPAAYPSLLTQLTYCAAAFSRVGFDFRALLGPLFSAAVSEGVKKQFQAGTAAWRSRLQKKTKGKEKASAWLLLPTIASSPPEPPELTGPPHIPPPVLASFPPIAELLNAILNTLNGLRLLAPTSIMLEVVQSLDQELAECVSAYVTFAKEASSSKSSAEDAKAVRASGAMLTKVLVPFSRRALIAGVYGKKLPPTKKLNGVVENGDASHEDPFEMHSELVEALRSWESWLEEALSA